MLLCARFRALEALGNLGTHQAAREWEHSWPSSQAPHTELWQIEVDLRWQRSPGRWNGEGMATCG